MNKKIGKKNLSDYTPRSAKKSRALLTDIANGKRPHEIKKKLKNDPKHG